MSRIPDAGTGTGGPGVTWRITYLTAIGNLAPLSCDASGLTLSGAAGAPTCTVVTVTEVRVKGAVAHLNLNGL